jgi:hypothetical protein
VHNLPARVQRSLLRFAEDGICQRVGEAGGRRFPARGAVRLGVRAAPRGDRRRLPRGRRQPDAAGADAARARGAVHAALAVPVPGALGRAGGAEAGVRARAESGLPMSSTSSGDPAIRSTGVTCQPGGSGIRDARRQGRRVPAGPGFGEQHLHRAA